MSCLAIEMDAIVEGVSAGIFSSELVVLMSCGIACSYYLQSPALYARAIGIGDHRTLSGDHYDPGTRPRSDAV